VHTDGQSRNSFLRNTPASVPIWTVDGVHPAAGILRKQMNSPLFNRFRPYPLGMCNLKGSGTYYIERQPNRKTEQGLLSSMLNETRLTSSPQRPRPRGCVCPSISTARRSRIASWVSILRRQECLANLLDPEVVNEAAAFHREFALVRGRWTCCSSRTSTKSLASCRRTTSDVSAWTRVPSHQGSSRATSASSQYILM
jgi:hypothetical protein